MTDTSGTSAVVLAAGLGTRMRSSLPKVLHPLCGRPMLAFVLDAWDATADEIVAGSDDEPAAPAGPGTGRAVIVYSPPVEAVRAAFADRADFALQDEPRG